MGDYMDFLHKIPCSLFKACLGLLVITLSLAYAPWLSEMEIHYKAITFMGTLFALIKLIGHEYDIKEATFEQYDKDD